MEKKKRRIQVFAPNNVHDYLFLFEGKVEDVAEKIKNVKEDHKQYLETLKNISGLKYNPLWDKIEVYEFERSYGYREEGDTLQLNFYVYETDEEFEKRMIREEEARERGKLAAEKRKKTIEEKERETLAKLKAKYEK